MHLLLLMAAAASIMMTILYIVSTASNGWAGRSWFWRFLITLLFVFLDLTILDALNLITVF